MRLANRTAVITGGAIGVGEGAAVALVDIDLDMAERTAAELVSAGGIDIVLNNARRR